MAAKSVRRGAVTLFMMRKILFESGGCSSCGEVCNKIMLRATMKGDVT